MVAPPAPERTSQDGARAELMTLYRIAFDDRNFQVSLNWDRTKHYFIFNFALFTLAGGLAAAGAQGKLPQLMLYGLAILNSLFGAHSIRKGHEYYRETRKRLKDIEAQLFADTSPNNPLAMNTTRGMKRERTDLRAKAGDRVTITALSVAFQYLIAASAAFALVWRLQL